MVLDIEDGDEREKEREGELAQHFVGFVGGFGPGVVHADAEEDRQQHEHQVLLDEVADGKGDTDAFSHKLGGPAHDEGNGEKGDDAAEGGEGDREGYVSAGQLGKDVGGAAAGAAGDEDQADEKHRRQVEQVRKAQRDGGQETELPHEGYGYGPRMTDDFGEIFETQGEPQVEHQ